MTIRLTEAAAREVLYALDVSVENIELDRLNDPDDIYLDLERQVKDARDVMVNAMDASRKGA